MQVLYKHCAVSCERLGHLDFGVGGSCWAKGKSWDDPRKAVLYIEC